MEDRYLADGVYASWDRCGHIILDLRGQDDTTRIALDNEAWAELVRFRDDVIDECEKLNAAEDEADAASEI